MTPTTSAHPDAAVKQICGSLSGAQGALGWARLWETSRTPKTPCAPIRTVLGPAFPLPGLHRSFTLHTAGPCKPSLHWLPTSLPLPQQGPAGLGSPPHPVTCCTFIFLKIPQLWSFLPHYAECIMEAKDVIHS